MARPKSKTEATSLKMTPPRSGTCGSAAPRPSTAVFYTAECTHKNTEKKLIKALVTQDISKFLDLAALLMRNALAKFGGHESCVKTSNYLKKSPG